MARPGRRVGSVGEKSREMLIEAAIMEFSKHGYHGTKISEIVKRAGLSQPSFYLYFESKEAIFKELEGLFLSRLHDLVDKSRLEPGIEVNDLKNRIKGSLQSLFEFFQENQDLTRIGLYISAESQAIKEGVAQRITDNLLAEQATGYFRRNVDMSFVALSLVGVIWHVTETLLLTERSHPESIASKIVDLMLYGLYRDDSRMV